MASVTTIGQRGFRCWECDSFEWTGISGGAKNGECRRNRPDTHLDTSATPVAVVTTFPQIADGTLNWCSNYALTSRSVPDIP